MSLFRGERFADGINAALDDIAPAKYIHVDVGPFAATTVPTIVFIANEPLELVGVKEVHTTASSSGTLQVERLQGTEAPTNGDSLLTGTISTAGTANTVVSGTVVTTAVKQLAIGDRLALVTGGTQTSLANAIVTFILKRF